MEQISIYHAPWEFRRYGQSIRIYERCTILRSEMISLADGVRIDAGCRLEGGQGLSLGENVHIGSGSKLNIGGGELEFGAHSGCSVNVVIATGNPDTSYMLISAAEPPHLCHVIRRKTVIGQYVVIFPNAYIAPGVTVGDGAIIWPGSVVTHDVPPLEEWGGVPARFMKVREVMGK